MPRPARQLHIRQEPPCCGFDEAAHAFAKVSELLERAEAREAAAREAGVSTQANRNPQVDTGRTPRL
jgi:hypothetical protein